MKYSKITFAEAAAAGTDYLAIHCRDCGAYSEADFAEALERFGADARLDDPKWRCRRCAGPGDPQPRFRSKVQGFR